MKKIRPINVLFLVNECQTNNIEILYKKMKKSKHFNPTVCACEAKAQTYREAITSKEIVSFFLSRGIEIEDTLSGEGYIDLADYHPDYIFVSTPYDIYRPEKYSTERLSKICKVCSIEYGTNIITNIYDRMDFNNNSFYLCCYAHFITNDSDYYISTQKQKTDIEDKFIPVGCLKVEKFLEERWMKRWKRVHRRGTWDELFSYNNKALRIAYKPRWTMEDYELFFHQLETILNISTIRDIQIFLVEHPFLQVELTNKGVMERYRRIIDSNSGIIKALNTPDFLDYVLESDVLICETTSLVAEYSITENPILLLNCGKDELNELGQAIMNKEGTYVSSDDNLQTILAGCIHKYTRRYHNSFFYESKDGISSSSYLLEWLIKDNDEYPTSKYLIDIRRRDKNIRENNISAIHTILEKGYYIPGTIKGTDKEMIEIDSMLKYWSDEAKRLHILEDNLLKSDLMKIESKYN